MSTTGSELDRGTVLALVAMALGVFVIANDFTAPSVAIPKIEADLGTDLTTAQWVINGYALVFGVLIVTGGRLADLFTTVAITALDPTRSSLAGGIIYMCQIAGGAIGLGLNTAIVASASSLAAGISRAFRVDAALAVVGFVVALRFVGERSPTHHRTMLRWHQRAHP